jgi:hypothetical protein
MNEIEQLEVYDLLYEINNLIDGVFFDSIVGYSKLGDIHSGAGVHPLMFVAKTTVRLGDDDPFEGIGDSVTEALKDLLGNLKSTKNKLNQTYISRY